MSTSGIQVTGFRELRNRARKIDERLRKRVYTKAVKAGGKVIVDAAKARGPVRTGTLARSIVHRSASKPRLGFFGVKVAVKGGGQATGRTAQRRGVGSSYNPDAVERYYRFTELGTKYHPAQPYLKPALDDRASEVLRVVRHELARGIEAAAV